MVISSISVTKHSRYTILSADITFRGKQTQQAYFKVTDTYKPFVVKDASPFLAAVLFSCMKTRENIYIDGSISEKFLKSTSILMYQARKLNNKLYRIKIRSKKTSKDTNKPKYKGLFFTADVDSFYTYIKEKNKKEKVTHLILPHELTENSDSKEHFAKVKKIVEKVAKEERIKSIIVETNIGSLIGKKVSWNYTHGGELGAVALFLRKNFKQILISGAVINPKTLPYSIYSEIDKLWSTEKMQTKNDGAEQDQFTKITKVISKSPLALKYLLVCKQNENRKNNCSRCHVCLTTMIVLTGRNTLEKAKTFDKELNLDLVKKLYFDYKLQYNVQGEAVLTSLKKQKRELELQEALRYSLEKSRKPKLIKRLSLIISQWDINQNEKRDYQTGFHLSVNKQTIFKFLFK